MRHASFLGNAARPVAALLLALSTGCSSLDEGSRAYDVDRYALEGAFDWSDQRLHATVTIDLNLREAGLDAIELDSEVDVSDVRIRGEGSASWREIPESGRLVVSVGGGRARGAAVTLEIDYEAATSDALNAVPPREGDPLPVRALYTDSEPLDASQWMPCNNTPSDRARFSVSMRADAGEMVIANGTLVDDAPEGEGAHRVRYETSYTLPTYLMAFAISDFEVVSDEKGTVPVSLWHRKGLPGSHDVAVAEIGKMIARFEELLGPYPFERYSLVLLPSFSGGMENASITFQRETSSTEPALAGDFTLTAHELAHQWFGDLVTVETWDDLWIKEGMATLLEYEAARDHMDASGAGTLNGDELAPEDGVPIRDVEAAPRWKYTSGPYDRSAWLLTQIRGLVGDEKFFATLRGVLANHRFGTIGTDAFIDAFAPALGAKATARVRLAVDAKALPILRVTEGPPVELTVDDPDTALVAPLEFAWIGEGGAEDKQTIREAEPVTLEAPGDALLVLDPMDIHPDWPRFPIENEEVFTSSAAVWKLPSTPEALARFVELGGAHQRAALQGLDPGLIPPGVLSPDGLDGFVQALDADGAKAVAYNGACAMSALDMTDPAQYDAWAEKLKAALATSPPPFGLASLSSYYHCGDVAPPEELFASEWAKMQKGLAPGDIPDLRLAYLAKFNLPPSLEVEAWGSVVKGGPSLKSRRIAAEHLVRRAFAVEELRPVFVDVVRTSDASEVLQQMIAGVSRSHGFDISGGAESYEALRVVLSREVTRPVHASAVCAAYAISRQATPSEDGPPTIAIAPEWYAFVGAVVSGPLSELARAYLADPERCL
jgi:aminopeptidase N